MARAPNPQTTLAVELERSLALVDEATTGAEVPGPARVAARGRAISLFGACGAASDAVPLVSLAYAAELLSLVAVDLAANPTHARRLIGQIDRQAGVPAVALGREMLQTGRLLELPVGMAIEIRLALLLAFIGARSVGLWTQRADGQLELASRAGQLDDELAESRGGAQRLLDGDDPEDSARVTGARIERLTPPPAVIVATGTSAGASHASLLIGAAVPVLSALLDRGSLDAREHATQETVMSSVERRLARLRFDLHDGPQQDIHLLAQDLSLFREQVRPMIAGDPDAHRLLGRLDDLEAQLVALDGDLRRLSSAVQSPFLAPGSLTDALHQLTDAFATRTGIRPDTQITGPLTKLTDSQQITLLALIREALSNIRKHSSARQVSITISSDAQGIRAVITDDGDGFDPEETLVRAARAGRLGLVGMHERVRMLGGRTHIESRAGGPTVISATLPPFPRPEP
ncbi:MAG: sensor histidine kinase [Solirubrobacteraceae bacterium]